METTYIDFRVLQARGSGEDYDVTTWATEEIAKQEAWQFLMRYAQGTGETFDTLEELQEYCEHSDLAYVEISFHRLPLYSEA